jgi:GST-like protein
MIDLYSWPTPNGQKTHIMLEETGIEYRAIAVDITKGDQFEPDFLAISPNNRIPAMIDHAPEDGGGPFPVFETGAMLIYLAKKTGQFLPAVARERHVVLQWLMFQMGSVGPMFGQQSHFNNYAPKITERDKIAYSQNRYNQEAGRLYGVMDRRLGETEYLGGDAYSIADMATFPWARGHRRRHIDIQEYPNFSRWLEAMKARPAVRRGIDLLSEHQDHLNEGLDGQAIEQLFGKTQYQRR